MLGNSSSYVFSVMFREFLLTTILGVLPGLVLLPVALATLGPPQPFASAAAREAAEAALDAKRHGGGAVAVVAYADGK